MFDNPEVTKSKKLILDALMKIEDEVMAGSVPFALLSVTVGTFTKQILEVKDPERRKRLIGIVNHALLNASEAIEKCA